MVCIIDTVSSISYCSCLSCWIWGQSVRHRVIEALICACPLALCPAWPRNNIASGITLSSLTLFGKHSCVFLILDVWMKLSTPQCDISSRSIGHKSLKNCIIPFCNSFPGFYRSLLVYLSMWKLKLRMTVSNAFLFPSFVRPYDNILFAVGIGLVKREQVRYFVLTAF